MKTAIAAVLALMLSTNSAFARRDDHRFDHKEFEHLDIQVHVVLIHNRQEFREALAKYGLKRVERRSTTSLAFGKVITEAFSIIDPNTNECTIYIKDPDWRYDAGSYGHELAHCIWGRWHAER
jgi:hypothetical protein